MFERIQSDTHVQLQLQIFLGTVVDKRRIVLCAGKSWKLSLLLAFLLLVFASFSLVSRVKLLILRLGSREGGCERDIWHVVEVQKVVRVFIDGEVGIIVRIVFRICL
jgi:hypothetical protein